MMGVYDRTVTEGSFSMDEKILIESRFLNEVFSWSVEDIFNDNLYCEKVKKIPETFETMSEYFSSFIYPLLEETRAELQSSLEIVSKAPFAEVLSYHKPKPLDPLLYAVDIDGWRNGFNDRGKEPFKTLPGDVFALVKLRPETYNDLQVVAQTWVLASVTKISRDKSEDDIDDDSSSTSFRVKTSKDIRELDDGSSSLFLVFLMNSLTHKRVWNALHMHVNTKIIRGFLQTNLSGEDMHSSSGSSVNGLPESILADLSSRLNPSQIEAVLSSLQATQYHPMSQVQLVWGPPGTGKTKTLSTLLYVLLKMNVRTLTCAPTNVAITEVASRVLELVRNSCSEELEKTFGMLGNILLFGNKQRLKIGSDIKDIFLDYRVKSLAGCFAPLTGWRSCFPCLSNFLQNCVSDYNIFVENELIKRREEGEDNVDACIPQIISFLDFVRCRFTAAAESVRLCISTFGTHMARSYIGECNVAYLICLRDQLYSFEDMLLNNDIDSEELLKLFSPGEVESSQLDVIPQIEVKRRKCISVLKTLHWSLGHLDLPSSASYELVTKLCFKMASLIFSTASSSSRLYYMAIKPLSLLVIDEAAQLKECESAIPLQLPGLRHAILFGDECQLPAMVKSNISSEAGFGRSLFQRLSLLGWHKHLLNTQYRMHPSISAFPNVQFYCNQILDAPSVKRRSYEKQYLAAGIYGPYSFINISEGRDELDDDGHSRRNMVEAAVVTKILHNLYKSWRHSTQRLAVGVVSPYAAQVVAIEDLLGRRYENLDNFRVKVKSVDGFQGGEEDIIILSTVRANKAGKVGFISDCQRTNVAITRARHCLWVLGNERTLARSESIWKTLVCNAKERNCLFNADEDKSLTEAMIDMKKELNQLDDLLNKDSIVFRSARWKVLFSDNFVKSFSKLPSTRTKQSVMNLLVKLSNGWRPRKFKIDSVCESTIQIVKQYKVEGRYVICTNDVVKETVYTQVMKIWDIVPLEDISALVRRLDNIYVAFTDDFLSCCKEKSLEGELVVPRTWSTSLDIARYKNINAESTNAANGSPDAVNYAENAKVSESLLLMKFYSLSAGIVGHLLTNSDGRALDLPFEVTDQEMQIILHGKSSFILGRSGTGKTTVLTMKLFQKEQLHHMALEGLTDDQTKNHINSDESLESGTLLRQLFVTVSPKLCYAIKQHVSHLKSFARGEITSSGSVSIDVDDIDGGDQFMGIPDSFVGLPPKLYPLVITFNKFLLMLDGTLGISYFDRFHDEVKSSLDGSNSLASAAFLMKRKEVGYDKFSLLYWPHFNSQFTKKLDASRVFTEIISCIKGGLQVGETDDGKLTLEGYLCLSQGRTSTLSRLKREAIYHIFLDYEKMKVERREFDLADFVNDLHRRLKKDKYDGDFIDFVYIDEVQDLTMRQIALFKYICTNVDEGFVFSGDTAQTIARGIDFRFQDVKCLFYNEFLGGKTSDGRRESVEKGCISPIFQLSENFRTHAGVLKLGQSVIELIYHFFPHSIDILEPETSLIFGEAPILLESGSDENAIVTIFGNNDNVGCNLVGFGAEQVILVRDDCARTEISNYVGKNALVLTIVECKGLEFQDVLLYNFFGSSPLRNQWRVIYQYMNLMNLVDSTSPVSFPDFSSAKHNVLCSELKQLYVAITRTRQRLWICENKEDLSKPMFDYWKKLCVVQVRELDDSLARAMQVASSPEEWKARGRKLLAVENYEVATMCFERAGDKHWETLAKALGLRASAGRMSVLNPEEASNILKQAGELFESINVYGRAADCYFELKDYYKAGNLYFQHCEESYLGKAGQCFTLAGCYELAATVYAKCNKFSECLLSCTKGKLFDMGLQYIQYWKHQNTAKDLDVIEQVFLENCAISQHQQDDKKAMMKFVKAFSSEDSMRAFLNKWGCFDELIVLEEELGNYSRAADIARERGEFLFEADLLQKGGLCKEACECYLSHVFANCLWGEESKGWPLKHFQQDHELLLKAKASASSFGQPLLYEIVCTDTMILLNRNYSLSQLQEFLVLSQNQKNLRGELLSTRGILDLILQTHVSKYELEIVPITNPAMYSLQKISQGKVSLETLIYFWNLWREIILSILKFLDAYVSNDRNEFVEVGEFCLKYLGIRKYSSSTGTVYVCLHPDADWLKEVKPCFFQKFGKLVSIDILQLLAAAQNYWSAELISTGFKVLGVIDAIQKRAKVDILSEFSKNRIPLLVYEVAQQLSSLKSVNLKFKESQLLEKYYDFYMVEHLRSIFPLDWRKAMSKGVLCLREAHVSTKILEGIVLMNIKGKEDLTYGQLGRVAMVLLGSRKCKSELLETVVRRLGTECHWKPFFEVLLACKRSERLSRTDAPQFSLACNLLGCLRDASNANWRARDFISPFIFLYLVDRFMISLLELQGRMCSTRSSLIEWFIHLEWKGEAITNLSTADTKVFCFREAYSFVADIVHYYLMNTRETVEWVKRFGINAKENFPVLLLRLVIILCMVVVNSPNYKDKLQGVMSRVDVTSQLPHAFCRALKRWKTVGIFEAVAEALNSVGDPLVLVSIGVDHQPFSIRGSIALDIVDQKREDLLRILFLNETEDNQGANGANSLCDAGHQANADNLGVEDSPSKIIVDWNVWELFDTLKLVKKEDSKSWQKFVSDAANLKSQVDKLHTLMRTIIAMAPETDSGTDDYSIMLAESECMLLELRVLSALLGTSGQLLKDSTMLIRDTAEKLLSGKHAFEYFLNPLIPLRDSTKCPEKNEADAVEERGADAVKEGGADAVEEGGADAEADQEGTWEDAVEDDTFLQTPGNEESSQAVEKNKGKQEKKRQRKKRNKRKK